MAIKEEYNSKIRSQLYDDAKAKHQFKDKIFSDNKCYYDNISGRTLHYDNNAAKQKYHMKNSRGENISAKWSEHVGEVDHIISIKEAHERYKNNPFLEDQDLKEVLNQKDNYRLISKSMNASKGEKNDFKFIKESDQFQNSKAKIKFAEQRMNAEISVNGKLTKKTVQGVGKEFVAGGVEQISESAMSLMVDGVYQIAEVMRGEKTLEEAGKGVAKNGARTFVLGGERRIAKHLLEKSSHKAVQKFIDSSTFGVIVDVANISLQSITDYVNGKISAEQCVQQIGTKGAELMLSGMVTEAVGPMISAAIIPGAGPAIVAGVVCSMVVSVACSTIVSICQSVRQSWKDVKNHIDDYRKRDMQLKRIESEALFQLEEDRKRLEDIISSENQKERAKMSMGFQMILEGACEKTFDLYKVNDGLDMILSTYGINLRYHTLEEYEEHLGEVLEIEL